MNCSSLTNTTSPVIGQLKAIKLSKSGLQGEALQDMIEYAKEHTAKELGEALKAGKPEQQPEEPKEESLEDKLERQSMLLARKAELEQELQEIMSELASLTKEVQLLAA
jgi:DNA-binding transcriptional MerR regulator